MILWPVLLTVNDYIMKTILNFDWNYNGYDYLRFYLFYENSENLIVLTVQIKILLYRPRIGQNSRKLLCPNFVEPHQILFDYFISTIWYNALLNPTC